MFEDDDREYTAVCNDEGQFSLWPTDRAIPSGWSATGQAGPRADVLDLIRREWTDLRPRSLRAWAGA